MPMYFPVALVLGSDNKPAKVRLFNVESNSVSERWLLDSEFGSMEDDIIQHLAGHWEFHTYAWMPLVTEDGKIARDGITVVTFYSYGRGSNKTYMVVDALGRNRLASTAEILRAHKNSGKRLFCNVDLEKLRTNNLFGSYSYLVKVAIRDDDLSSDITALTSELQQDIRLTNGRIELSDMCNAGEQVIIPDFWRNLHIGFGANSNTKVISFPHKMSYLGVSLKGSPMKTIILPEEVQPRIEGALGLTIYLIQALELEEVIVPDVLGKGTHVINAVDCPKLRVIRQRKGDNPLSRGIQLYLKECPNLEIVDTPNYSYTSITTLPKAIKVNDFKFATRLKG